MQSVTTPGIPICAQFAPASLCPGNSSNLSEPGSLPEFQEAEREETFPARCGCDASQGPGDAVPAQVAPSRPSLTATGAGIRFYVKSIRPLPWSSRTRARISGHTHTRTQTRGHRQVGNFVRRSQRCSGSWRSSWAQAPPPGRVVKRAGVSDWSSRRDNTCSTPSFK